ncbi:V-type proton ATPase subunit d [Cucumispora dikerogammari]|nr:V-type proton ATPase subunit d [Cucumispora dikerogammari]
MSSLSQNTLLSEVHTLFMTTLTNTNLQQFALSKDIKELTVKLATTSYIKILDKPIETNKELSKALDEYFRKCLDYFKQSSDEDIELKNILDFIISEYQIDSFIYVLTANDQISEKEMGFFDSLNSFLYLSSLDQLFELTSPFNEYLMRIKNNPDLKIEFGTKFRDKNNLQKISLLLKKYNLETTYRKTKSKVLKKILKNEGDRAIIDILFSLQNNSPVGEGKENTVNNDTDIYFYFPFCTNFSDFQRAKIVDLKEPSVLDLKDILSIEVMSEDSITNIGQALFKTNTITDYSSLSSKFTWIERKLYAESFDVFNDISCIFSYLKIRETEIKDIKYISECIEAGKGAAISEMYVR